MLTGRVSDFPTFDFSDFRLFQLLYYQPGCGSGPAFAHQIARKSVIFEPTPIIGIEFSSSPDTVPFGAIRVFFDTIA